MPRKTIKELEAELTRWQETVRELALENRELRDELLEMYRRLDPYRLRQQ